MHFNDWLYLATFFMIAALYIGVRSMRALQSIVRSLDILRLDRERDAGHGDR